MHILPPHLTSLGHVENLIFLCPLCHHGFDHSPPFWIVAPKDPTIQMYILHERADYSARESAARRGISLPRTLPQVDRTTVQYQVYILNGEWVEGRPFVPIHAPRGWLGHLIPAIIKACAGIAMPSVIVRVHCRAGNEVEIGIPERVRSKLMQLVNLWSRPDPVVRVARTGPGGPSVGPSDRSVGGRGGRLDPAKKRKGEGSGGSLGASERKLRSEVGSSRRKVEDWLTQIAIQQDTDKA